MDRRKDGWTWTKEILGTAIAVIGVMAWPFSYGFNTLQSMKEVQASAATVMALHSVEIMHLKESKASNESKQDRTDAKLDKIIEQLADIKVQAARAQAGK